MENNISFLDTEIIDKKIQIILGQTDYTKEYAMEKLKDHCFNEISVIRSYFGVIDKQPQQIKSVNQEIFRQLRYKLDSSMRDYRNRVEKGEVKKII